MFGFEIKEGVYGTLQEVMTPALDAVARVWSSHALGRPVITSIEDGTHQADSKHYQGLAFDVRLNNITADHETLRGELAALLGPAFDVVHEYHGQAADHMHLEYDPT